MATAAFAISGWRQPAAGRLMHFRSHRPAVLLASPVPDMMTALVFQNAACAWRCWYCFVPEELLKADLSRSAWFTAAELVDLYRQIPNAPRIIDLSGRSPDLVPEWTPWMMRALIDADLPAAVFGALHPDVGDFASALEAWLVPGGRFVEQHVGAREGVEARKNPAGDL